MRNWGFLSNRIKKGVVIVDELHKHKFERLDEKFDSHEFRLNNHSVRIDVLEREQSKFEARMEGLIKQLELLNITMRWFIGVLVGALVTFFFYAVQQGVFH